MTNRDKAQRIYDLFRDLRGYHEALADSDRPVAHSIYLRNPDVRFYQDSLKYILVDDRDFLIGLIEGIIGGE